MTEDEIETLREADKSWNTMTITAAVLSMIAVNPALTLADFERQLREDESETYLIALPLQLLPIGMRAAGCKDPLQDMDGYLWVCLHGEPEAKKVLSKCNGTAQNNLRALETCGILCVKMRSLS